MCLYVMYVQPVGGGSRGTTQATAGGSAAGSQATSSANTSAAGNLGSLSYGSLKNRYVCVVCMMCELYS